MLSTWTSQHNRTFHYFKVLTQIFLRLLVLAHVASVGALTNYAYTSLNAAFYL